MNIPTPQPSHARQAFTRSARWWARSLGPYLGALLVAVVVHPRLLVPTLFTCALTGLAANGAAPRIPWRHSAAAVLALGLLLPMGWLLTHESLWPVALALVPGLLLGLAHLVSRGRSTRWLQPQPFLVALGYLFVVLGLGRVAGGRLLPPMRDDSLFTLYAAAEPPSLAQPELEAAVALVDRTVRGYDRERATADSAAEALRQATEATLPARFAERSAGPVFVTLWLDRRAPQRGSAAGGALGADIALATLRALDASGSWRVVKRGAERLRIQLDLAGPSEPLRRRPLHPLALAALSMLAPVSADHLLRWDLLGQLVYELEPGIDGVELRLGDQAATMLPADPIAYGWLTPRVEGRLATTQKMLDEVAKLAGAAGGDWRSSGAELRKFRTASFGRPSPQRPERVVRWLRGNVRQPPLDADAIRVGLGETGRWLGGSVRPNGTFDYEYFPNADKGSADYNAVRHVLCVYALYRYERIAREEPSLAADALAALDAAERSLGWVYEHLRTPPGGEGMLGLYEEGGDASSGGTAGAVIALLERPAREQLEQAGRTPVAGRKDDAALLGELGAFLLAMVDPDAKVFANWLDKSRGPRVEQEPLYSPGEVLLALARLYERTRTQAWLDGARRIAARQMTLFRKGLVRPDHWVMQGLGKLHELTGERDYADVCLAMGDVYVGEQYGWLPSPFADYRGAYRRDAEVPRTTRACSSSEAIGAVTQTAWRLGVDASRYEQSLLEAARHILEQSWHEDNSYFLPNPRRAYGAVRMGIVDNACRIDNNQHALVGLEHALAAARRREQSKR